MKLKIKVLIQQTTLLLSFALKTPRILPAKTNYINRQKKLRPATANQLFPPLRRRPNIPEDKCKQNESISFPNKASKRERETIGREEKKRGRKEK